MAAAIATAMAVGSAPASAQDSWEYKAYLYLWGAGIGGKTTTGQDIDVSFGDLVDNLEFGIMGSLEAKKGPWAIFGDAVYLNIADDGVAAVGPGIPVSVDADVKGLVFTTAAGYDVIGEGPNSLNAFGGVRYVDIDTTVNLAIPGGSRRLNGKISNLDGIVGVRGTVALSDKWDLFYYGDIGTGDSDFTAQAILAAEYKLDKWALSFGYRHLYWDIDNSPTVSEMEFSGPIFGAKFRF